MKRILFPLLIAVVSFLPAIAQTQATSDVILTPYVVKDVNTPNADKILYDKLNRIVVKYGVSAPNGQQTPFIITAHAVELNRETTATAPPMTAVELSLTIYIGNGEDGTQFSTCNFTLKGVGRSLDQAYASAFKRLDINDPQLIEAINESKQRIIDYYTQVGPGLINNALAYAGDGNYADAYNALLQIPQICPQYSQAQDLLVALVEKESDAANGDILLRARAAWTANPNQAGASEATEILKTMSNASDKMRASADALMSEMAKRLQKVEDAERAEAANEAEAERKLRAQEEAHDHQRRMAEINGATKVAVARAKRPVYNIVWW